MQAAYVLHRWPYQEHSLIIEVFAQHEGRIRLLAKGAKRSKRGQAALLQPFRLLQIDWRGRSELKSLISVDSEDFQAGLSGDYLYCGFYMNELLQRLLPEQASVPELFNDYHKSLLLLRDKVAMEPVLRKFEWTLLKHLQLDFDWLTEVEQGDPIATDKTYYFKSAEGFAEVLNGREPTPFYQGQAILKMADFALSDEPLLRQFKWVMRSALAPYLGTKPLRSRELFQQTRLPLNQR